MVVSESIVTKIHLKTSVVPSCGKTRKRSARVSSPLKSCTPRWRFKLGRCETHRYSTHTQDTHHPSLQVQVQVALDLCSELGHMARPTVHQGQGRGRRAFSGQCTILFLREIHTMELTQPQLAVRLVVSYSFLTQLTRWRASCWR